MFYGIDILVVDNYDSFTFNLVHAFRELVMNEGSVIVVKNDDIAFMETDVSNFDLIVLSPGPGDPHFDCGIVTDRILDMYFDSIYSSPLPVLFGVCMGFEAIAIRCGGKVIKGVPCHGQKWPIEVLKSDDLLFENVSRICEQVRYHSLVLPALYVPDTLDVTSVATDDRRGTSIVQTHGPSIHPDSPHWLASLTTHCLSSEQIVCSTTNDTLNTYNLCMSFRHKTLPIWAVQFHPESILSHPTGLVIMENICKHAHVRRRAHEVDRRDVVSVKAETRMHTHTAQTPMHTEAPVCTVYTQIEYPTDPEEFFYQNFFVDGSCVWQGGSDGWSYMCGKSQCSNLWAVYVEQDGLVTLVEGLELIEGLDSTGGILSVLKALECEFAHTAPPTTTAVPIGVPCIFTCLGYEAASHTSASGPNSVLIVTDRVLAMNSVTKSAFWVHTHSECIHTHERSECTHNMSSHMHKIATPQMSSHVHKIATPQMSSHMHNNSSSSTNMPLEMSICDSYESYLDKIRFAQCAIEMGESYELCVTTQVVGELEPCLFPQLVYRLFKTMRSLNPAPYSSFWWVPNLDNLSILCASPEKFLQVNASGVCEVKPIKGTRKRGATLEEDSALVADLQTNAKDLAENLMIVDLVRNDLARIGTSVCCPKLMQVETYQPYHQLVSTVQAQARVCATDTIASLFPAGSMTGAPKMRSMQILHAIEARSRGIYSGALGIVSPNTHTVDLCVIIRTICMYKGKISIGCGGAILAISDPQEEWKEMLLKARTSLRVIAHTTNRPIVLHLGEGRCMQINPPINTYELFTTMRYEKNKGIWLGNRHINRFWKSSSQLHKCTQTEQEFKQSVLDAILKAAQNAQDTHSFETTSIQFGPFRSAIFESEWMPISLPCGSVRIRINSELDVQLSPLNFSPIDTLYLSLNCVDSTDFTLVHKTRKPTYDPAHLYQNEFCQITESGICNVAVFIDGKWITPKIDCGVLPGTLRGLLLDTKDITEGIVHTSNIKQNPVICFNSIRGVFAVNVANTAN